MTSSQVQEYAVCIKEISMTSDFHIQISDRLRKLLAQEARAWRRRRPRFLRVYLQEALENVSRLCNGNGVYFPLHKHVFI